MCHQLVRVAPNPRLQNGDQQEKLIGQLSLASYQLRSSTATFLKMTTNNCQMITDQ